MALVAGLVAVPGAQARPTSLPAGTQSTPLVVVDWDATDAADEAHAAEKMAEKLVPAIEQELFQRRIESPRPIRITLHGDFYGGNPPQARVPHVDAAGTVHLYRYGPTHLHAMAHELVHAVLRRENVPYGRFDEEGLAAWVSHVVRPSNAGFPTYGQDPAVVSGHWLVSGLAIPMNQIRDDFRGLNLRCSFQTYSLRNAFFIDLGEQQGNDAMRRFLQTMRSPSAFSDTFGSTLIELEREWLARVERRYERTPNAADLRREYRALPALDDVNACAPGRDFGDASPTTDRPDGASPRFP